MGNLPACMVEKLVTLGGLKVGKKRNLKEIDHLHTRKDGRTIFCSNTSTRDGLGTQHGGRTHTDVRPPLRVGARINRDPLPKKPAAPVGGTTFKSSLVTFDPAKVIISNELLEKCNAIQETFQGQEFSVYVKGKWTDKGFEVHGDTWEEIKIPNQEVTSTAVFPDNSQIAAFKVDGYNTVIHSHPFARSSSFSGSDRTTISLNSVCSILYSFKEFTTATLMFEVDPTRKVIIDAECEMLELVKAAPEVPEDIKARIKVQPPYDHTRGGLTYQRGIVNQYSDDSILGAMTEEELAIEYQRMKGYKRYAAEVGVEVQDEPTDRERFMNYLDEGEELSYDLK